MPSFLTRWRMAGWKVDNAGAVSRIGWAYCRAVSVWVERITLILPHREGSWILPDR